jgi:acyl CoA:acetate/3-ketoacid CoA transferase alpha subunit
MTLFLQAQRRFVSTSRLYSRRYLSSELPHSKVVSSAKEALKGVDLKGATVCVGGFGLGGIPETLLNELSSTDGAEDLVVASLTGGVDGFGLGRLLESGKVKRLISSYVGENKYLESSFFGGTLEVELTPQGTLAARMKAAGAGFPAFYTPTGAGTVYANGGVPIKFKEDESHEVEIESHPRPTKEFDGQEYVMVSSRNILERNLETNRTSFWSSSRRTGIRTKG